MNTRKSLRRPSRPAGRKRRPSFLAQHAGPLHMIVYGVLDSPNTLLSAASSAFDLDPCLHHRRTREAREKLKENGVHFAVFPACQRRFGEKIYRMMREAFDGKDRFAFMLCTMAHLFSFRPSTVISHIPRWLIGQTRFRMARPTIATRQSRSTCRRTTGRFFTCLAASIRICI